ncbi:MAG: hypothetical protein HUJ26_21400 [Planctomycetaceae bacterium]|nr:hypothetical protein [Planctomycetaceae bacterium]
MQDYKKRIRVFSEKLGGILSYGDDESLTYNIGQYSVTIESISREQMNCTIKIEKQCIAHEIPKNYVFDVMQKLSSSHLTSTLTNYELRPLLQLEDYINEEQGQAFLDELRQQIADNPELEKCN